MVLIGDPYVKVEDEGGMSQGLILLPKFLLYKGHIKTGNILPFYNLFMLLFKCLKALSHTKSFSLKI